MAIKKPKEVDMPLNPSNQPNPYPTRSGLNSTTTVRLEG